MHAAVLQAVPFPLRWQIEVNVKLEIPRRTAASNEAHSSKKL